MMIKIVIILILLFLSSSAFGETFNESVTLTVSSNSQPSLRGAKIKVEAK